MESYPGKMKRYMLVLLSAAVFICAGCNIGIFRCKPGPTPRDVKFEYFNDLQIGKISKVDVKSKYGEPAWDFKEDNIFVYRFVLDGKMKNLGNEYIITMPAIETKTPRYSVILVFDDKGVLSKRKILEER